MIALTREAILPLSVKISHFSLLSLLLGGLLGCDRLASSLAFSVLTKVTPIGNLQQQQQGQTVYLEGEVGDRAPFLGSGAYQLRDETGEIWVITNGRLPATGSEVSIEGQVSYSNIPVGEQDLGELYIVQVQQLQSESGDTTPQSTDELFLPHKGQ